MNDLIDRQDALDILEDFETCVYEATGGAYEKARKAMCELQSQSEKHDKYTETHACDCISRQGAIDAVEESRRLNHHQDGKAACAHEYEHRHFLKLLRDLPSAQPEPCEDTVSRQRLLSDLKELVAAWKKYPVMAEQIKGVEAAIGYVEAIPSAQPEPKWIPCSEKLPEKHGMEYLVTISDGSVYSFMLQFDVFHKRWYLSFLDDDGRILTEYFDDVIAWMPLPEPYAERRTDE